MSNTKLPALSRGQIIDEISSLSNNSADHDIDFAYRILNRADRERQAGEAVAIEALKQIKIRLHFMGWPAESMWNAGTDAAPRWIPDWRYEIALIENALHGTPITVPAKPTDTVRANSLPVPQAVQAEWKLVPVEPIEAMVGRALYANERGDIMVREVRAIYAAMLASAPSPDGKAEQAEAPSFNLESTPISGWGQQPIGMSTKQTEAPSARAAFEHRMIDFGWRNFTGEVRGEPACWYYENSDLNARWIGWREACAAPATQPTASPEQAEAPSDEQIVLAARSVGGFFDDLAINYQSDDLIKFGRAVLALDSHQEAPQTGEINATTSDPMAIDRPSVTDLAVKDAARQLRKVLGISQDFDDWPLDKLILKAVEHIVAGERSS